MESTGARADDLDPADQLRALERAEAMPFVVYPPTPRWYMAAMGAVAAGLVASFELHDHHPALFGLAGTAALVGAGIVLGLIKSRYGAFPSPGRGTPREIRRAYADYLLGMPVVAALVALVWWAAGPLFAAAATLVLVTTGLTLYERRYAKAARAARRRLGIADGGAV